MWNPCCGLDIHRAAKAVAVFDVMLSIVELGAAFVFESGPVQILSTDSTDPEKRDVNYEVSITLLFGICLVIMRIIQLSCSILLLYGVVEKNYRKCAIWFMFSLVVLGLAGLQILFEILIRDDLAMQESPPKAPFPLLLRLLVPGLELLIMWYLMWVVAAFMANVRKNKALGYAKGFDGPGKMNKDPLSPEERDMIDRI